MHSRLVSVFALTLVAAGTSLAAPGHRLRISVQAFDVPHLLPPAPDLPSTLEPLTIHTSPKHPRQPVVTLPTR